MEEKSNPSFLEANYQPKPLHYKKKNSTRLFLLLWSRLDELSLQIANPNLSNSMK
jgi:hypothetical protein